MITAGTKFGPYEISSPLGAGGMGEVYRARDTRLGRDVAIKVLPQHLSSDPDLKARFEREARAISALSHPHICHLYDIGSQDGTDFIVMELLEGESLADRLQKGPLPVRQVLDVGIQIAEALEKAHKQGIVHRDLKPGNIMLTKSGAKLLDFGLAKPTPSLAAMASGSMETMSKPLTGEGKIVGTYQYMAPEQIQGQQADSRTDIFALGAVLYEAVTGKRAFRGKSQVSVMSAILEKEPEPITAVQPLSPPALDHVIRRALAKESDERWQSASDLKAELKWIASSDSQITTTKAAAPKRWRLTLAVLAFALVTGLAALLVFTSKSTLPGVEIRATIPAPEKTNFLLMDDDSAGPAVISPDGANIAFTARGEQDRPRIWLRALNGNEARQLNGTDAGTYPFWSADGKWIGFFANGKLKRVPIDGGPALEIADAPRGRGGSWGANNVILFAPDVLSGIMAVPAKGGTAKPVTTINSEMHTTHRWPTWLPDNQRFLYLASSHGNPVANEQNGIYVGSVDGKENRMLMPASGNVAVAPGYLVYLQSDTLMAQPFDDRRGELTADSAPIAQDVAHNASTWRSAFDVSPRGILVYQSGGSNQASQLLWLSPGNKPTAKAFETSDNYRDLRLSADGRKLLVNIGSPKWDLWICDLARGVKSRLTFSSGFVTNAAWSPDGKRIAYSATGAKGAEIYLQEAGGSGKQEAIMPGDTRLNVMNDWSKDGQNLLFYAGGKLAISLYVVPPKGGAIPKLFLSGGTFTVQKGQFSPDSKWVAYLSSENGGTEAYVTSFPDANGKWQISSGGANSVHWFPNGRALLYEKLDGTIMKVPFSTTGQAVDIGAASVYVNARPRSTSYGASWDVAPDGRVIVNTLAGETRQNINVVVNWTVGVKK